MLYSIKEREDLEKIKEVDSLQNQVRVVRSQNKPGKQNSHEDMEKFFEPVTETKAKISEDLTKTMMLTSTENNKGLENLNNKLQEIMNNTVILASHLMSLLSKITNL